MPPTTGTKDPGAKKSAERLSFVPLVVAFVAVTLGFIASTIYGEVRASAIDAETAQIEGNSLPSVEHLAAARAALRRLEVASDQYADESGEGRREAIATLEDARAEIERELRAELASAMYPGEKAASLAVTRDLQELDQVLLHLYEMSARSKDEGRSFAEHDVRSAMERADASLGRLMTLNATQAHAEAKRIADARAGAFQRAVGLDAVCVVLSVAAALLALRAHRRQLAVERAHEAMLVARADELELFAKRVAHDLLSPLSALSFTLSSVRRNAERALPIAEPLERADACLKRSQRLVQGILDFARSAASPSGKERTMAREAIDGVLEEVRADAEGTQVIVEPFDDAVEIACPPGILTSILSNLVRNALKYTRDRTEKRVTIRVSQGGTSAVRVEVEDTGPGLPPGLEERVFEPYVRAPDNPQPGLGLGLATVRRFVEAHHGHAGVESFPGRGCLFWFELPSQVSGPTSGPPPDGSRPDLVTRVTER